VRRVVRHLPLLAVLAVLATPAVAHADPVTDCAKDGKLDKRYSNVELKKALNHIPGDLDEYSNCRQVIAGAIQGGSDKGGGRPIAGGSKNGAAVSPAEQARRAQDGRDLAAITGDSGGKPKAPTVEVGGKSVKPGSNGLFNLASQSNDIPAPLLAAMISLVLLAVLGGVLALRGRVPVLGRIPLLSKIPTPRVSLPRFRR
jgi:hypothetical protein